MNLNAETYNLLMNVAGAFYPVMGRVRATLPDQPAPPALLTIRGGYAESPGWYMIQAAEFDPEPLTVEKLRVRDIYASPSLALALLEMLASEKWLDRRGQQYFLTAAGREIVQQLKTRPERFLEPVDPLGPGEIEKIEAQVGRIIDASLSAPTPPGAWCLTHSRNRAPDDSKPALVQLFHYFSDFNAFRDDAHMAAFTPHEPEGYIWEGFTLIADGRADSAASLFDQIPYRGYALADFGSALSHLTAKGWIESGSNAGSYRLTTAGEQIRAEVEAETDRYFYAPWAVLSAGEIEALIGDLKRLMTALQNDGS